jgi:peptide deformylase
VAETEQETREERAEREARRLYVLASVRQYPDPVLRMRTHEVTFDDALRTLVARMITVMQRSQGVGLAAPQIGVLARVLVHQTEDDAGPVALVNPSIVASSPEREAAEEGCLSLDAAGVTVEVERPASVTVEARSPSGDELRIEVDGLTARAIQHEVDHLDGVLIIDRTTAEQRKMALGKLRPQPVLGPVQSHLTTGAASSMAR